MAGINAGMDRRRGEPQPMPTRRAVFAALAAVLVSGGVAPAARTVTGRVEIPTFGSPALARTVYATAENNGTFGWVLRVAPGRPFTLATTDAPTSLEDFDIAFYATLDATAPLAAHATAGPESGSVPLGAVWGVITLSAGSGGSFAYTES